VIERWASESGREVVPEGEGEEEPEGEREEVPEGEGEVVHQPPLVVDEEPGQCEGGHQAKQTCHIVDICLEIKTF
jgi:hypothetical protein